MNCNEHWLTDAEHKNSFSESHSPHFLALTTFLNALPCNIIFLNCQIPWGQNNFSKIWRRWASAWMKYLIFAKKITEGEYGSYEHFDEVRIKRFYQREYMLEWNLLEKVKNGHFVVLVPNCRCTSHICAM